MACFWGPSHDTELPGLVAPGCLGGLGPLGKKKTPKKPGDATMTAGESEKHTLGGKLPNGSQWFFSLHGYLP